MDNKLEDIIRKRMTRDSYTLEHAKDDLEILMDIIADLEMRLEDAEVENRPPFTW